jgi:hypothetical protein
LLKIQARTVERHQAARPAAAARPGGHHHHPHHRPRRAHQRARQAAAIPAWRLIGIPHPRELTDPLDVRAYRVLVIKTQGGRRGDLHVRELAAALGVKKRMAQYRLGRLELAGTVRRRYRKVKREWNLATIYQLPHLAAQLHLFRSNLKKHCTLYPVKSLNLEATTPKNAARPKGGVWKTTRRRPWNHPPEVLAAWERRRRMNHPPELEQKYKEKAAMWKHMQGWRPNLRRERLKRAASNLVGVEFASEHQRETAILDAAERMGMSTRQRRNVEQEWAALAAAEELAANTAEARAAAAERARVEELDAQYFAQWWRERRAAAMEEIEARERARRAEQAMETARVKALQHQAREQRTRAAAAAGSTCYQCDGKGRTIHAGRIVDCWVCKGER